MLGLKSFYVNKGAPSREKYFKFKGFQDNRQHLAESSSIFVMDRMVLRICEVDYDPVITRSILPQIFSKDIP